MKGEEPMSTAQQEPIEPEVLPRLPVAQATNELVLTEGEARAAQQVQARILVAKKFPRNEDRAFTSILKACSRPTFADRAEYIFPRGTKKDGTPNFVRGPTVYLARELSRVWGNMDHGFDVISEDENRITIRGWAWDLETNAYVHQDNNVRKVHQRKVKGQTEWVPITDERDLRELRNRQGALIERNCMLALIPEDLKQDAINKARETIEKKVTDDPDGQRKAVLEGFLQINVPPEQLEKYLHCPVGQASPKQLVDLRGIWRSIVDGNTVWTDYVKPEGGGTQEGERKPAPKTKEGLKQKLAEQGQQQQAGEKPKKGKKPSAPEEPAQSASESKKEGAVPPPGAEVEEKQRAEGDPCSDGQMAVIQAMHEATPQLQEIGRAKLKSWEIEDPSELSYGGARDFIRFLEEESARLNTTKGGK
jgi:hypothetical protein